MNNDRAKAVGASRTSALIQLAVTYSDALDRCTRTGGETIDDVMELFAEDAVWTAPTTRRSASYTGKAAIRDMYLGRAARLQQQVALIPLAYTTGTDFRPASRTSLEGMVHWEQW